MKILIPYDGSQSAQDAVQYALKFAKGHDSTEITLLTVACNDAPFARDFIANPMEVLQACQEFFQGSLEKAKSAFVEEGVTVNTIMASGDVAEVIINTVNNGGYDKVIMGRRGLSALKGLVLGSVSSKVLANVEVPVTLIK